MKSLHLILLVLIGAIGSTQIAHAQSAFPENPGLATASFGEIMENITSLAASALAPLAILFILLAGIMFMVSGGNEERIGGAKRMLTYTIIGLIIALLGWVIVSTIAGTLQVGDALQ